LGGIRPSLSRLNGTVVINRLKYFESTANQIVTTKDLTLRMDAKRQDEISKAANAFDCMVISFEI
jgi:methyl-accepting chemotaxis protein